MSRRNSPTAKGSGHEERSNAFTGCSTLSIEAAAIKFRSCFTRALKTLKVHSPFIYETTIFNNYNR